jgi:hypothetical protein
MRFQFGRMFPFSGNTDFAADLEDPSSLHVRGCANAYRLMTNHAFVPYLQPYRPSREYTHRAFGRIW